MINSIIKNRKVKNFLIIIFWLIVWEIFFLIVNEPLFLASPLATVKSIFALLKKSESWKILFYTSGKMLLGYFAALILGVSAAWFASKFLFIEDLLKPLVVLTKSIPVASFIVLALAWFSSVNVSIFICFLVVFPTVYFSILAAIRRVDIKLLQMCQVFGVSSSKKVRFIFMPEIADELCEVVKITVGMGIRSSIAAELIGLPNNSIGGELYQAKLYLAMDDLFAWTIFAVVLCYVIEKVMIAIFTKIKSVVQKA